MEIDWQGGAVDIDVFVSVELVLYLEHGIRTSQIMP
jgi:hypothetical protein